MGTSGKSVKPHLSWGSNTVTAIRHLDTPLICIDASQTYKKIRKIAFACDFKDVNETIPVELIKQTVKIFQAELHIIHIHHPGEHLLQSTHVHQLFDDLHPTYHFPNHQEIEKAINGIIRQEALDLLIAVPKKHKLFDGIFHPSDTKKMLFHSIVPLMFIRN
ncbi:hypothetical protein LZZ85_18440 [Terrimonas sp. NA20]|uniref:UspA domain-containing protein n=1 Tax=Terrimonas ginsenosidimutans TaxID=2908004 RepID=A0ABS9KVL5_9BACT|nr:hypothetical protein [Terrimonas ginsenosidimutans]MCG2616284.1 hypothetical protein [Terrimonas ginsenosidimutans]